MLPGTEQDTRELGNLLQTGCSVLEDALEQASFSSHKI